MMTPTAPAACALLILSLRKHVPLCTSAIAPFNDPAGSAVQARPPASRSGAVRGEFTFTSPGNPLMRGNPLARTDWYSRWAFWVAPTVTALGAVPGVSIEFSDGYLSP